MSARVMNQSRRGRWLTPSLLLIGLLGGCGSPTPPAEPIPFQPVEAADGIGQTTSGRTAAGVDRSVVIMPPDPDSYYPMTEFEARRQAGIEHLVIDFVRASSEPASSATAQAIDNAVRQKIAAILLIPPAPGFDDGLDQAIARARDAGVHIVSILRTPLPEADTSTSLRPLSDQANSLVAATLEIARANPDSRLTSTRAAIVVNGHLEGPWADQRAEALREAALAHGLELGPDIQVVRAARAADEAQPVIDALAAAEPPAVLLAVDSTSLRAAARARDASDHSDAMALGGFTDDDEGMEVVRTGVAEAAIRTHIEKAVRAGVSLAAQLIRGDDSVEPVVITERLLRRDELPIRPTGPPQLIDPTAPAGSPDADAHDHDDHEGHNH